ncbi:MAG: ABC transporter permease [Bryobacterales bacterium]
MDSPDPLLYDQRAMRRGRRIRERLFIGIAKDCASLAAIAAVAGLMLSCYAPGDREVEFDHPADSTYEVSTGQLQHGDALADVQAARVTAEFFAVINRSPWLGRVFLAQDFEARAQPMMILSHSLWENELGGKPEIIGRTLLLDGRDHIVIGVMPPGIEWPPGADLWIARITPGG